MANQMNKVWKMFGVDEFEEFNLIVNTVTLDAHTAAALGKKAGKYPQSHCKLHNPYHFFDTGLIDSKGVRANDVLVDMICGAFEIERRH